MTHAPHVDRNRRTSRANSRSESRSENRGTANGYGATADLADYLRNTGPPPTMEQQPQPFILNGIDVNGVKKEEGGLKKFFTMRGRKG